MTTSLIASESFFFFLLIDEYRVLLNTAKDCNTAKDDKGPQIDVLYIAKYNN